jgi:putative transposase
MRTKRLKIEDSPSVYHTMSRVVGNAHMLGYKDKVFMEQQMIKVSLYTGVEVITYAFMDNHFHMLLRVLAKVEEMSDDELVRRTEMMYGRKSVEYRKVERLLISEEPKEDTELEGFRGEREELRKMLVKRMNDLSMFMKMFKQRVSIGFNGRRNRLGTMWMDRFKSILIENDPLVVIMKAAYQDLNPLRAGLVKDPREYQFTGYARAMAGSRFAREGLMSIGKGEYENENWEVFQIFYERVLFGKGACREKPNQAVISNERVNEVMNRDEEMMKLRMELEKSMVEYENGLVMGTKEFVDSVYGEYLHRPNRRNEKRSVVDVMKIPMMNMGEDWNQFKREGCVVTTLKTNRVRLLGGGRRCET